MNIIDFYISVAFGLILGYLYSRDPDLTFSREDLNKLSTTALNWYTIVYKKFTVYKEQFHQWIQTNQNND